MKVFSIVPDVGPRSLWHTLREYILREQIGAGGYGAVYRGEQLPLERDVVVKVLHAQRSDNDSRERFLREAKLASQLRHPYAAHVYAFGAEDQGSLLWIAMELVQGVSLHDWLGKHGPMSLEQFVAFFDASEYSAIAFSADGHWLATSGGGDARVVDTTTWKPVLRVGSRTRSLRFDPRGSRLAIGTASGDAAIWAVPGGERIRHLREVGEIVDRIAWSPDGALVVTASRDGMEQVFEVTSGALLSQGNYLHARIRSVEFDATSKFEDPSRAGQHRSRARRRRSRLCQHPMPGCRRHGR